MKVVNVFAQIFATFAFLTIGSLLILVAIRLLSLEDALLKVQELYTNPGKCFQTGLLGFLFVCAGLIFARTLVKTGRDSDAVVVASEIGPIVVSALALEDVGRKVCKKFHLVKECKSKAFIHGKKVEMKLKMHLWSGSHVPELLAEIQEQIRLRVKKLIGNDFKIEISCDVQKIEDHDLDVPEMDEFPRTAVTI